MKSIIFFLTVFILVSKMLFSDEVDFSFLRSEFDSYEDNPTEFFENTQNELRMVPFEKDPFERSINLEKLKLIYGEFFKVFESPPLVDEEKLLEISRDTDNHIPIRLKAGMILLDFEETEFSEDEFVEISPHSFWYFHFFPEEFFPDLAEAFIRTWIVNDGIPETEPGGPSVAKSSWSSGAIFLQRPSVRSLFLEFINDANEAGLDFATSDVLEAIVLSQQEFLKDVSTMQ